MFRFLRLTFHPTPNMAHSHLDLDPMQTLARIRRILGTEPKRTVKASVIAGPLGFYGCAGWFWLGHQRDTIDEALCDAVFAGECIEATTSGVLV